MADLATRIQDLMKQREEMQDKKRSLEVEIRFKEERLAESKAALSEKGVDYETLEDLKTEIEDKKERLEDVVSNMERTLSTKGDKILNPTSQQLSNPVPEPVSHGLGTDLNI